jgi:hypothetical protein
MKFLWAKTELSAGLLHLAEKSIEKKVMKEREITKKKHWTAQIKKEENKQTFSTNRNPSKSQAIYDIHPRKS